MGYLRLTGDAERDVDAVSEWLSAEAPDPLVISTSGSSGTPKQVLLRREAVLASAAASAARLGGSGPWLLALPSSYVAGFNVVVRSLLAGHRPVALGDRTPASVSTDGAFVSVVPTQLHRWLDSPADRAALGACHTVLVGGGPVDPSLRARADEAGVRAVATYGSAETCGGCVYDGVPLDGVGLALAPDGRIRIAGPTIFDGYLDAPEATREALVDGWFVTSDAGRLEDDGRLRVLGRVDDIVVSGGVNVPAAAVAARLREHPSVTAAEVVGLPDAEWGNRVVAIVSLVEPGTLTLDEARDWVAAVHPRPWAPREVRVVAAIPMLANGKVDRLAVRDLVAPR
ncbi:AMP-binding protein [Nocardioides cynanchi]|uniref:AMP-binding protein n=1 Tax=Nocardioides cynanchi TaxID=2558918 RepID=UPI001245FDF9|nr:AMP-binding protein [Nocardioides cynanchi]